jgi:hypothetical protein
VAETALNLRFHHAMSSKAKLRTFASFMYQAGSWKRPRKVVARLECSLQPVAGETGMRQEVDIRYVVTSLKGSVTGAGGALFTWEMQDGNYVVNHNLGDVGPDWEITGTGEFDLV